MKKLRRIISQRVRMSSRRLRRRVRRLSPTHVLLTGEAAVVCALLVFLLTGSRAVSLDRISPRADLTVAIMTVALAGLLHVMCSSA